MLNEKLRQYRKARGWTQDDLAERSGFSRSSIINWESGKRAPRSVDIDKLAIVLGVQPRNLIDDSQDIVSDVISKDAWLLTPGLEQNKQAENTIVGLSYWGGVLNTVMHLADTKNLQQIKMVASLLKMAYETLSQVIEQLQVTPKGTVASVSAYNGDNSNYTGNTLNLEKAYT